MLSSRAGKNRRPTIEASLHPFLEVIRLAQNRLLEHLALGRRAESRNQIQIECLTGGLHSQRTSQRDFRCHFLRDLAHLVLRHQTVGEAHRIGFVAWNAATCKKQPSRPLMSDHPRQRDRHSETGVVAHGSEVRRQPRLLARDAKVRDKGKAKPGANGTAVNSSDDGLARLYETLCLVIKMPRTRDLLLTRGFVVEALPDVRPGAEVLTSGGKHDAATVGLLIQGFERRRQVGNKIDVEEVVGRPPDLNGCYISVDADADFFGSDDLLLCSL